MNKENEVDKLFEGLPKEDEQAADPFDENKPEVVPEKEPEVKKEDSEDPEKDSHKNRRHRRLEQQLQSEREARIRAEALAQARSEASSFNKDIGEIDQRWIQIYGDTPESRQAFKLYQEMVKDHTADLKAQAIKEMKAEQEAERHQQEEFESHIDNGLEDVEDEFNVDLTSNTPAARKARREFLELVESLSPKDSEGNLTGYADFNATWEIYQMKKGQAEKPDASRNKELAARSMANGKSGGDAPQQEITPGFRGWMKDFNIKN